MAEWLIEGPETITNFLVALAERVPYLRVEEQTVNGQVGLKTNMAISAFQKSIGERGDGQPSEQVRAQLEKALAARGGTGSPGTAAAGAGAKEKTLASTGTPVG